MDHDLLEIVFGLEHIIAEFFWNGVFVLATYFFAKGKALRNAHRYIDQKHGVEHDEGY
jgi:hypothetical protein